MEEAKKKTETKMEKDDCDKKLENENEDNAIAEADIETGDKKREDLEEGEDGKKESTTKEEGLQTA